MQYRNNIEDGHDSLFFSLRHGADTLQLGEGGGGVIVNQGSLSDPIVNIQLRHDTLTNWQTKNSVLLEGEMGIAYASAPLPGETWTNPICFKIGKGPAGLAWNSIKEAFYGFRDVDLAFINANGLAGQGVDFANPSQLGQTHVIVGNPIEWIVYNMVYRYAPPALDIQGAASAGVPAVLEVGSTYGPVTLPISVNIVRLQNVAITNGARKIRIDDEPQSQWRNLSAGSQATDVYNFNKTFLLNSPVRADLVTIKAAILDLRSGGEVADSEAVAVRFRKGFFTAPMEVNLCAAGEISDAQLSALLRGVGNAPGWTTAQPSLLTMLANHSQQPLVGRCDVWDGFYNENFSFTASGGAGQRDIYTFMSLTQGSTMKIASQFGGVANPENPTASRDFQFTNGNATSTYRIIRHNRIDGPFDAIVFA